MLLDLFMPRFDFYERHSTFVHASPERTYDAILNADLGGHPIVKMLMAIRGMGVRRRSILSFSQGFAVAANEPPSEIVIGIEGPFWKLVYPPHGVDAEGFKTPVPPDTARGAFNFFVQREDGGVRVITETRVLCAEGTRWKFGMYWMFIRPFSGLIRRLWLRMIRREAEA